MGHIRVYRSRDWHRFAAGPQGWSGGDPIVMLVPEGEVKQRVRDAFATIPISELLTLRELIDRYVRRRGFRGLISGQGVQTLLASILSSEETHYFNIEQHKSGYTTALADFIQRYRDGVALELASAIRELKGDESLSVREEELIRIHDEFEGRLAGLGHDFRSGARDFIEADDAWSDLGFEGPVSLVFLGFDHVDSLETELICRLLRIAPNSLFLIAEDERASEQALRIRGGIASLLERVKELCVEQALPGAPRAGSSETDGFVELSNELFAAARAGDHAKQPGARVEILREKSRSAEVLAVARRIRELMGEGASLSDVRVVLPQYPLYTALIAETLPRYGIPATFEPGIPLLHYPLGALADHLVNQSITPNPFSLREKIFSSPYVTFEAEIDAHALVSYQEKTGVEFLTPRRLEELLSHSECHLLDYAYLKSTRMKAYRNVSAPPQAGQQEVIRRYLSASNEAPGSKREQALLRGLIQLDLLSRAEHTLYAWSARMTASEFARRLTELLALFKVPENVESAGETEIVARDRSILETLREIGERMPEAVASLGVGVDAELPLSDLARLYSRCLSDAVVPRRGDGGVTVQPVRGGIYRTWVYTFICGLVDGELPAQDEYNFLHPRREGLGLGERYTAVDHARNRFHQLIRSTTGRLFLTLPLADSGRKLAPSPFITDLENCLAGDHRTESRELRSRLYTLREKVIFVAATVDDDCDRALPVLREIKADDGALFETVRAVMRFDGLTSSRTRLSAYDGIFAPLPATLRLLGEEIDGLDFTAQTLERYAACPAHLFLDDIMKLKSEPDFHPDTSDAGRLVRSILVEYTESAAGGRFDREEAAHLLGELAERRYEEQLRESEDAFSFRLKRVLTAGLGGESERRPGLLKAFLDHEEKGPDLLDLQRASLSGSVRVEGGPQIEVTVDRADLTRKGDTLVLYLYTTADTGKPGNILRGLRFDLPLAILLLKERLEQEGSDRSVGGGGFYLVRSAREVKRGGYFAKASLRASRRNSVSEERPIFSGQREGFIADDLFDELLMRIAERIKALYGLMKRGVFHVSMCSESESTCHACSFSRVCRRDELRIDALRHNLEQADNVNVIRTIG